MKPIQYNKEKDAFLKKERKISFKDIENLIEKGEIIDIINHPNTIGIIILSWFHSMKNKKLPKNFFKPLDEYERQLLKDIENDEFVSVPNVKEEIKRYKKYAQYTLRTLRKDKRITIRVPKQDLDHIQNKAIETGIPYQTLIASILHQFSIGKIRISI